MTQLELAMQYLESRALTVDKKNSKSIIHFGKVLPMIDVIACLNMVKEGTFESFYQKMKEKGHPEFT